MNGIVECIQQRIGTHQYGIGGVFASRSRFGSVFSKNNERTTETQAKTQDTRMTFTYLPLLSAVIQFNIIIFTRTHFVYVVYCVRLSSIPFKIQLFFSSIDLQLSDKLLIPGQSVESAGSQMEKQEQLLPNPRRTILQMAVAGILNDLGFEKSDKQCVETLTEVNMKLHFCTDTQYLVLK